MTPEEMKQIILELNRDIGTIASCLDDATNGGVMEKAHRWFGTGYGGDQQMIKDTLKRLDDSMDKLMTEYCK